MIILLVGPTGVGKTTSYKLIEKELTDCAFCHLDGLASRWGKTQGWLQQENVSLLRSHIGDDQLFLAFGLEAIGAFAEKNEERHCIIDVGAGFQDARSAKYLSKIHRTVALTGDPEAIYQRKLKYRGDERNFEKYARLEFSVHRREVYKNCDCVIDTTHQTESQTAAELKNAIRKILKVT